MPKANTMGEFNELVKSGIESKTISSIRIEKNNASAHREKIWFNADNKYHVIVIFKNDGTNKPDRVQGKTANIHISYHNPAINDLTLRSPNRYHCKKSSNHLVH